MLEGHRALSGGSDQRRHGLGVFLELGEDGGLFQGEVLAISRLARQLGLGNLQRSVDVPFGSARHVLVISALRPNAASCSAAALFDAARERGLGLAVVSSSAVDWVRGRLARLDVLDRFGTVVTGDDVPVHKPAPDLYLHALTVTGLTATHVVAFEDSPTGVAAATAAGLRCVAVPNGTVDPAALGAATLVVPSLVGFTPTSWRC